MNDRAKFPQAFVERIEELIPPSEQEAFFEHCTEPLPKTIRVVDTTTIPKTWKLDPTPIEEGFFIQRPNQSEVPLGKTLQHFTGQIYSQSLSSMLPVVVLDPQPGEKILDLCAAPGSKTTFLGQRMENTGVVIANEPSSSRSKKLTSNLDRLGSINNVVIQSDGSLLNNFFAQEFDKILLDAPCSSEGFGRRDRKYFDQMWSEKNIFQIAKLQKRLIISAFEMLRPGGTMVYSTCTSAPEENEEVVQHLLNTYREAVTIEPTKLQHIPHHSGIENWNELPFHPDVIKHSMRFYPHLRDDTWNSESFFIVKITKNMPLKLPAPKKPVKLPEIKIYKKNQTAEVVTCIAKQFGLPKSWPTLFGSDKPMFVEKQGNLYLTTQEAARFTQSNLFRRVGLLVWDKDQNFSTEFTIKLAPLATKNTLDLDTQTAQRWREGYDLLEIDQLEEGQVIIVRNNHFGLGWGKVLKNKLKNKLDRNLIN